VAPLWIALFRTGFCICFCVVTWLALTTSHLPGVLTIWDKGNHFSAFIVLSFLLDYSFPNPATSPISPNWLKWLGLFAYGVGIECVQGWMGTRDFQWSDMFADAVGISGYLAIRPFLQRIPWLAVLRHHNPQP